MSDRAGLGRLGERLATTHLEQQGYHIRARNVRLPPWGEIDLVAERDGVLALVEVRIRRGERFGSPLRSITPAKRARMLRAARAYLTALGDDAPPARIDVIGITLDHTGRTPLSSTSRARWRSEGRLRNDNRKTRDWGRGSD